MDANVIIAQLREELINQKGFLWNKKNKEIVTNCIALLDDLKASLPAAIQESSYIISQKQKILSTAQETANKIIADAQEKAKILISQERIVKEAQTEVNNAIENANKRCNQLFMSTKDNIDKMLKSIEDYLMANLNVVRTNREELASGVILNPTKNKSFNNSNHE